MRASCARIRAYGRSVGFGPQKDCGAGESTWARKGMEVGILNKLISSRPSAGGGEYCHRSIPDRRRAAFLVFCFLGMGRLAQQLGVHDRCGDLPGMRKKNGRGGTERFGVVSFIGTKYSFPLLLTTDCALFCA